MTGKARETGCVYFIETGDGEFLKIGYSEILDRRIGQIEATLRPTPIKVLGFVPGTRATESWFHSRFSEHRERGEWFRFVPELREFVQSLKLTRLAVRERSDDSAPASIIPNATAQTLTALRNQKLSPARRSEIAQLAANARWGTNPTASEMGKLGGPARALSLTPERRKEIATNAVQARWAQMGRGKREAS